MTDTIRSHIKRRMWWCAGVAAGGWGVIALGGGIAKELPDAIPREAIPVVGVVLFLGGLLAMQRFLKCPKCKANLGRTIAMPVAFSWGSGPKINFCPYCGVNLDEPVPGAQPVAQSQNPIHP